MKIMEFCLKWVHMARYELIIKLDGALRLRIISWDLGFGTGPHVEGGIPPAQFLLSTAFSASSLHKVLEHAVRLIFPTLRDRFTKAVCQNLTYTV